LLDGVASLVTTRFIKDGNAMRLAAKKTARDHLADATFKDMGVPARETVTVVDVGAMMILLIFDEWQCG